MARLIALLLFAVYLLSFSGQFHSADELSALAVTERLVSGRGLDSNLMTWAQYGQSYAAGVQGRYGADGNLYSKRGLFHSLLPAPLFALGGLVPALGRVHLALLTTSAAAALTGALVYLTGRRLGFARAPCTLAALAYGLATPAWPYARALMGEPFIELGLAAAAYGVVANTRLPASDGQPRGQPSARWPALVGAGLGLAAGVNLGNLVIAPVAAWATWRRGRWRGLLALAIPLALALALIGVYNGARFGSPFDAGRDPNLGEGFNAPVNVSLPALIFSPARGLLWFNPLIWLALAGALAALRRRDGGQGRAFAWYVAAVMALYLAVYGTWYMWWGGYAWGPRFLVPLSALAALAALPALSRACASRGAWRVGCALVIAAAFFVQLLGVLVPAGAYEVELTQRFGFDPGSPVVYQYGLDVLYDWSLSPILGHARLLLEDGVSDVAWLASGVDWAALLPLGAFVAVLAWLAARAVRGRAPGRRAIAVLCVTTAALTGWAMARSAARPTDPFQTRQPALDLIAAEAAPGDGALIYVPEMTRSVLNNYAGFPAAWGMPPLVPPDAGLETALATAQARHERLWLLSWFDTLDPDAWAEARLAAAHYALGPRRRVGGLWVSAYAMQRDAERWQPAGWELDGRRGIRLAATAVEPARPRPGDTLQIALRWEATHDIAADYVIYVHLLDAAGAVVAGADHAPQNGFRPTWTWKAGEAVIDRVALALPPLEVGAYTLRVGMYDWRAPAERLQGATADGELTDGFTVMQFAH